MDQGLIQRLFALLRSAICGTKLTEEERDLYATVQFEDLLQISAKHDVGHLVAMALKQNGLMPKEDTVKEKYIPKAIYRYTRLQHAYENLCTALETARIPFLPLKGAIIREYYPELWMRTSCDIDILVHEENLERAVAVLSEAYGYTYRGKGSHDISLFTPDNIHIELHYDLIENRIGCESADVLGNVWNMATVRAGFSFWYEMPDEMVYLYHIAHMAKHVKNGGCGIRPFIDLWVLDNLQNADKEKRNLLLGRAKLLVFANAARSLSRIWFTNGEYDPVSRQLEAYILRGGVYGNSENRIVIRQQKEGGRLKYLLSKVFLPYETIRFYYPILQKHRWLTPLMEVRRWCRIIFCGHLERTVWEMRYNSQVTSDEAANAQTFLENIGL